MIRYCTSRLVSPLLAKQACSFSEGAEFLNMVEKYFDKAGQHTSIRSDLLNFYKRADNVVKFNLTLLRGNSFPTQMTSPLRSFPPIDASTRRINYQQREVQGMLRMLILLKLRHLPV